MTTRKPVEEMNREERLEWFWGQVEKLAQPVDLEGLQRDGILTKAGAWYRVKDVKQLPETAQRRISEIATDSKGVKVKFSNAKVSTKLQRGLQEWKTRPKS